MSKKGQKKEVGIGNKTKKTPFVSSSKTSFINQNLQNKTILFVISLLLYGWTIGFEYGIDDKFITSSINNIDNSFDGFLTIFKTWFAGADYRPISFLSFWLERKIYGFSNPHLSHIVNAILFGFILLKIYDFILVSKFYKNERKLILLAVLCSIIYAVHPNHVSVVANIKARDNLLSMLFGLFAAIQLIYYFDYRKIWRILLFIVFITLAFLSKIDAYVFIIAPLLIVFFFRDEKLNFRKLFIFTGITFLLFFLTFIITGLFKLQLNKAEYIFSIGFDENPIVGNGTLINRISLLLTSLFYYLKFLFFPSGYYFFYGYNQIPLTGLLSIINITASVSLLLFTILCYRFYHKNRIYTFALLFFLLSIAYALNFYVTVAGIVMDKYNFIASFGFCLALAALIIDITNADSMLLFKNPFIIFLIFVFTFFTFYRTKDWRNSFSLIEKDMPSLTKSVNANRMAAGAYINLALAEELKPNNNRIYTDSLISIGERYAIRGLNIYDKVPDLWELKGLASFYKKDYNQALHFFLKSKEVDSTYLSSINYIGYTYWALNNSDSAEYYFNYVIAREPVFDYSANNLINMLLQQNRKAELDSILYVFKKRFPNDKWLNKKIEEISLERINFKKQ